MADARFFMKYWFTSFIVSGQQQRRHEQLQWGQGQRSSKCFLHLDPLSASRRLLSVSDECPVEGNIKKVKVEDFIPYPEV